MVRAWVARIVLFAALALLARDARAHPTGLEPTLHEMVLAADLVARAKIVRGAVSIVPTGSRERYAAVDVEVLEVLAGESGPGPLRFAAHPHGGVTFVDGDEVLLFLAKLHTNRDLAQTRLRESVGYVALEPETTRIVLSPGSREALLEATRRYLALRSAADPTDVEGLRRVTLSMLASRESRLALFALRDLSNDEGLPLLRAEDAPLLREVIADPTRPLALRLGLLGELEQRRLGDGSEQWARWLRELSGEDLLAVTRAASATPSPVKNRELERLARAAPFGPLALAAVSSLGVAGNDDALAALGALARDEVAPLREAAVRALARVGSARARDALEGLAADESAAARGLAQAELARLGPRPVVREDAASQVPAEQSAASRWALRGALAAALLASLAGLVTWRRARARS